MTIATSSKTTQSDTAPYALQVTAEAIRIMFHNLPRVSLSVMLMILVMVWVMWASIDHFTLLAWAAAAVTLLLGQIWLGIAFIKRKPPVEHTLRWGRYYTFHSVVDGFVWGSACVLFFVSDSAVLQVFLFTCMVGMATSTIIHCSYWIESYYAFILPLLTLSGLRLLWEGGNEYQGLAALTALLLVLVIQMAHESRNSVLGAIRLRFENTGLIEQLRAEKEKAEIGSRDKTRFLASASHDLRQPVHALTLFADALQAELVTERSLALLGNIGRSIEAINQLLSSLLDISKLDANIIKANPGHFPLSTLLNQLDAEYAPQAHSKGLAWHVEDSGLSVYSDRILLETMLRNLISNAIRYTRSGHIAVKCLQQGAEIFIEIIDTGIGIPDDQKKEIFREFYQLENSERDRSKGLGLGLAIVERVAALLNHRIILDSEPDRGSRFTIVLSAGNPKKVIAPASAAFNGQRDVNGMRILVIEDEADVRKAMQAVLESWGCSVILADSEEDALDKMQGTEPPHAIVADYRLRDGKTGGQAIESLRHIFNANIPALIITGDTDPERLKEAQVSGHSVMHKPLQPGMLRTYLRKVQRRKA
jgi:two-component system, sensor histidine kinase